MGKTQRHHKSRSHLILLVVFILVNITNAGLVKRSIRTVREVYPPDIEPEIEGNRAQVCIVGETVYDIDEIVPAEQPCLKCRCQPPGVQCETVQCVKKPGCKAIHRPNRCCPDYQCECEHNGQIYGNGEKLETHPGGECKVCYCRGGELQCAEISCYIRKDCEGKGVPGQCCPKYDHCPPIDSFPDRPAFKTEAPLVTPKFLIDLSDFINLVNSTHPPMTTTSYNILSDENKVPDTENNESLTPKPDFDDIPERNRLPPRITIQEIIPERKEIPITAPSKLSEPQGTFLIEESIVPSERMDDLTIPDSDPESSEIAEVFQHPPPVLRIGDKLLFLKKGEFVSEKGIASSPESVITIIGAEGLQRGFEESYEIQDGKLDADNIDTNSADTNELELKTAESTHIISFVKRKEKSQVTSTTTENVNNKTTKEDLTKSTTTRSVEIPIQNSETGNLTTEPFLNLSENVKSNDTSNVTQAQLATSTEQALTKNTEPIVEQNPAYPPLPDIMPAVGDVSQKFEVELESDNETVKILPDIFELLENSTEIENKTAASYSDWLKTNQTVRKVLKNETLLNYKGSLPEELLNARSPIDFDEDSSTELVSPTSYAVTDTILNETLASTVKTPEKIIVKQLQSTDKLLVDDVTERISIETSTTKEFKTESTKLEFTTKAPELLEDIKPVDEQTTKMADMQTTKTPFETIRDLSKSIESLEHEDSGEQTTRRPDHSAIVLPDENASVQIEKEKSEARDMTQNASKVSEDINDQIDSDKVEALTKSILSDVEILVPVTLIPISNKDTLIPITPVSVSDVELITPIKETAGLDHLVLISSASTFDKETPVTSVSVPDVQTITTIKEILTKNATVHEDLDTKVEGLPKPTQLTKLESSTYEFLPMPEHASAKMIKKRNTNLNLQFDDATIEVFPKPQTVDPNKINNQSKQGNKSKAKNNPEHPEDQEIFKELLDELSTEQSVRQQRSRNGQDTLDGLTGALTSFALGGSKESTSGQSNSGGVLGFIGNIFSPNRGKN